MRGLENLSTLDEAPSSDLPEEPTLSPQSMSRTPGGLKPGRQPLERKHITLPLSKLSEMHMRFI